MVDTRLSRTYLRNTRCQMSEMSGVSGPKRSFTEEFKRDAGRLAIERGNVSAVARDRGIHGSVLNRCKRQLQQQAGQPSPGTRPFPGRGNARDEEMAKIQRENARLEQENEILKKAVGIFTSRPQ